MGWHRPVVEMICLRCGRRGVRQFISATADGKPSTMGESWICSNDRACLGRLRLRFPRLQYAVVYLPDGTLTPEAVGPFYSRANATLAADAIDTLVEDTNPYSVQTPTTVVTLLSLESALERLR